MPKELELVRAARARNPPDQTFAFERADTPARLGNGQRHFLRDSLDGRLRFSFSAGELHQPGKHQLLGREQIGAPQDLRRDERAVKEAEGIEYVSYLEA